MRKINIWASFLLVILFFWVSSSTVSAHVLKTDGNIGAVLHVDPDDDPIANSPTTFYFEIKDKTGKFTPENCGCRVDIYEGDKIIYSDSLFQQTNTNNITAPVFQYTFPQKDVYQVKVIGLPQRPGDFQPFTLVYDLRVARIAENPSQIPSSSSAQSWFGNHIYHLIGGLFIFGFFGIIGLVQKFSKKA